MSVTLNRFRLLSYSLSIPLQLTFTGGSLVFYLLYAIVFIL